MSHLNVYVVAAHSDSMFCIVFWPLLTAHLHRPVLTLPLPNCSTALTSCREAFANPQFRHSLQVKAIFRKGFSKTLAKDKPIVYKYSIINWNMFPSYGYIDEMPRALIYINIRQIFSDNYPRTFAKKAPFMDCLLNSHINDVV